MSHTPFQFAVQQRVVINSTDELGTVYDGQEGWIHRHWIKKPEWWTVLTKDGKTSVFHESQLSPVGIEVKDLHLTQEGFRHSVEEICEMIQFVRSGGRFDARALRKHNPNCENLLVAITKFEDGSLYIRDGFHRAMAVFIGRPNGMLYDNEYFIEDLTYLRMMTPRLEVRYYTPFDPRVEVRASDFGSFRDQVDKIIQKKQDPLEFIRRNRNVYVRSKKPHHETVKIFAEHWMSKDVIRSKIEAQKIVMEWMAGNKIELSSLTDDVLKKVQALAKSKPEFREIFVKAEYAWHEKYGGDEDNYCGGY